MATIVVGVDGTDPSDDALTLARSLARPASARLLLATAVPYPDAALVGAGVAMPVIRDGGRQAERRLEREAADLEADGYSVEHTVRLYDSAPWMLQSLADERAADLIVVGSARSGRLGRVLPGTTGERLIAGAPCPVAVAPRDYRPPPSAGRRIGVAVDGSQESLRALEAAATLATTPDATLQVIAVLDAFRYGAPALMGGPGYDRMRNDLEAAACERLDAAVAQLPPAVSATPMLLAGDPARALAEHSRGLDLLVVGSRRYGPVRAVLLGGVSGPVIRSAACPVVVVPRGQERPLAALAAAATATTRR
jgi:nucleotide-binding universal stress UspA family protein